MPDLDAKAVDLVERKEKEMADSEIGECESLPCNYDRVFYPSYEIKCKCGRSMQQYTGKGFFPAVGYCPACDKYKYEKEAK